jgi:hypothetical protein
MSGRWRWMRRRGEARMPLSEQAQTRVRALADEVWALAKECPGLIDAERDRLKFIATELHRVCNPSMPAAGARLR